ncbi:hypothetical protein M9Y10_008379 [Tritrichomonas musculus]|uniref:Viral A-type inclusion protein n=1 Tax=Tritrichomonas musculus TaxID=1915356 RepID=A0ABR2IY13_9EUKA
MDFYDSDQSFSHCHSDLFDNEDKSFAEEEKLALLDKINELTKQNTVLKAQFEQAIATTKQMNEIMLKNSQQNAEIRSLKNEKDQLQNRLEISLKSNEEYEQRLEKEKSSYNHQLMQLNSEKDLEVSNAKKQCNAKLDAMAIRLNQLEDCKTQLETQNQTLLSKFNKLNQAATNFFQISFDGIESLTSFFEQSVQTLQNVPSDTTRQSPTPFDQDQLLLQEDPEHDHSKCKKKINALKKHCQKFVAKIEQLQNEINESGSKHSKEVESFKHQIHQLKDELSESTIANNQTIQQLQGSNESLKSEIQKLKKDSLQQASNLTFLSNLSYSQNQEQPKQQQKDKDSKDRSLKKKLNEIKELNESYKQENIRLKDKIRLLEKSNTDFSSKIKDLENQQSDLTFTINRLEKEKSTADVIHKETLNELQSVRDLLHSRNDQNEIKNDKNKKEIEKLQAKINQFESTIKSQKNQIHTQELENQSLKNEKETMSKTLNITQDENKELENKVRSLNEEIIEIRDQLNSKPDINIDDILPPSSLRFQGFDPVLSDKIEGVIGTSFSPSIKISRIYSIISNYYENAIKDKECSVQHMTAHLQNVKNQLNKLFVDISLILAIDPVSFDDIIDRNKSEVLLTKISGCCKGYDDLKRKNTELNVIVERITDEFGTSPDMPSYITSIRQKYEAQTNILKKQIKKYQEVKKSNKLLRRKAESTMSILEQQNAKLTSELCEMKALNGNLTTKLQSAKSEMNNIKRKYESIKATNEHTEDSMRSEHDQIVQTMSQNFMNEKSQLLAQFEQVKADNEKLKAKVSEHELSINRLKSIIQKHRDEIKERDEESSQLKENKNNEENELRRKFDIEKNQLVQTYENAIAAIQAQMGNQRNDSEQLSSELKNAQNKIAQIQSANAKLKKEKKRLEEAMKENEEQVERERKIQQVTTQNQIATIENKYSQMIEDAKAKCESDKMKIFSYAVSEFKRYSNQCESINERSYRSLITKVRKELDRLTESDSVIRQIANAVPKQSTDEAVSKLRLS